jgi:transposase-like protein
MPSNRAKPSGRVSQLQVTLTPAARATLAKLLRSSRCPYGLHKRARAVLLAADGMQITEIARRTDMERRHVYRWVARYLAEGVDGLHDLPRDAWQGRRKEETTHGK